MITLIRRDATVRMLLKWIILTPLVAMQVVGVRSAYLLESGGTPFLGSPLAETALWIVIVWIPLAVFAAISGATERTSHLHLALPLAARRLWSAHLVSLLLSGLALLAATLVVMALPKLGLDWWLHDPGPVEGAPDLLGMAPRLAAGFVLAVVLLQTLDPLLYRTRVATRHVLLSIAVLVGTLAMILVLSVLPVVFALVPLVAAYALGRRVYRTLPAVFSLVPREAEADAGRDAEVGQCAWAEARARTGPARYWMQWKVALRSLAKGPRKRVAVYPFLVFLGMILGGVWLGGDVLRYYALFTIVFLLVLFSGQSMVGLYSLDSLRISRRRLFACLIMPGLLMLCLGYGTGRFVREAKTRHTSLVSFWCDKETEGCCIRIPVSFCEIAWDGNPPDNAASWGESYEGWREPIWRGSRPVIYGNFCAGPDNSKEFVALQYSRAIQAVYGTTISLGEISERYLRVDEIGRVVPVDAESSIPEDYPEWRPVSRGPVFPVAILAVSLSWFLLLSLFMRTVRAGTSERARTAALWGLALIPLAMYILAVALTIAKILQPCVVPILVEMLTRYLGKAVPGGAPTVWVICGVLFAGAFWLAEKQFEQIEVPSEWGKK